MKSLSALWRAFDQDNDALAEHRHGIVKNLCLLGGLLLCGTMGVHAVSGNWRLVALNVLAAGTLLWSAARMWRGGPPPLPFGLLAGLMISIVFASVHLQGLPGVVWSFPLVFVCYFALPRRLATGLSLILIAGVTLLSLPLLGQGLAARVSISLVFVMLMINVVLSVIGELQQALLAQAITDPLTGAYNRRHLQARLDGLTRPAGAVHDAGAANALLALDIDHFKQINDRHGHDVGDEVLRRLVDVLTSRKRLNDLLFRTGGEEFMLLLPRIGEAAALQMAEDLRQRIATGPLLAGEAVTVSIGVSLLAPGEGARQWFKRADTALYDAKRGGRDRVVIAPLAA